MATIQIRNVPDEVHRTYRRRAALAGMSLQEYLRSELVRHAGAKTPAELVAEVAARMRASGGEGFASTSSAEIIHRGSGAALIVLDASVIVDALLVAGPAGERARRVVGGTETLAAPAMIAAEVTAAVRSWLLRGVIGAGEADAAVVDVRSLQLQQFPFEPLAERVWELRENVTVYDGWYVALAEALGTELVTADQRLVGATGPRCPVVDVASFASR